MSEGTVFSLQFGAGVILGLLAIAWFAGRYDHQQRIGAWLDVGLGVLIGGTLMARLAYVLLEIEYFRDYPEDSWRLWYGGLSWHGALIGGLIGMWLVARWRHVSVMHFTDALALAFPLGMLSAWWACRRAGCGCGQVVDTRDDLPGWLTGYLPDITGNMELRLELQIIAVWISFSLLVLMVILTLRNWLPGLRLWLLLFLTGLVMFGVGFFRGDSADMVLGRRVDQNLDVVLMIFSALIGFGLFLRRHNPWQTN